MTEFDELEQRLSTRFRELAPRRLPDGLVPTVLNRTVSLPQRRRILGGIVPGDGRLTGLRWRRLLPISAAVAVGVTVLMIFVVPRPPSAIAIIEEAQRDFEQIPPFHAIIAGHVPAREVAHDTGGAVSREADYRWELWYQSSEAWRLTLLDNSVPSVHPGPSGSFILRTEQAVHRYDAATNTFAEFSVASTSMWSSPLGLLSWGETGTMLPECQDAGNALEVLSDEQVAGRDARHIRCASLFEIWIDAETGLLLKLIQPQRGDLPEPEPFEPGPHGALALTPGDRIEITSIEYDPTFPQGTLDFAPPEGAAEAPSPEPPPPPRTAEGTKLVIGEAAPPWSGRVLSGGTLDLSQLRGRPAVVMFWMDETACPDPICGVALRQFQAASDDASDRLSFISVVRLGDAEMVEQQVAEAGYTFTIVLDSEGEVSGVWGVIGAPTYVLLDEEGRVVDVRTGMVTDEELQELLSRAP